jgi:diaminopimelate epimerase
MSLEVYKYQGLGNDFVLIDRREGGLPDRPGAWAKRLCRRRFGVGADGVLYLLPPSTENAKARMRIFNADGSEAEMCGNGLRCLALHLRERLGFSHSFFVDTESGPRRCRAHEESDGSVGEVTVDMGRPRWDRASLPMSGDGDAIRCAVDTKRGERIFTGVSMGNPHMVIFQEDLDRSGAPSPRQEALDLGPALEVHEMFPERVNVSFVRRVQPRVLEAAVWERGCGLTAACGTGACAIGVAACLQGREPVGEPLSVRLPGGTLSVTVDARMERVHMRGPAARTFVGRVSLADLELPDRLEEPFPQD